MSVDKRLFAGCEIDPVLKRALSQNPVWLNSGSAPIDRCRPLERVQYSGKEYIGCYFAEDKITLDDLLRAEDQLRQTVSDLCPDKTHHVILFTQLLIS